MATAPASTRTRCYVFRHRAAGVTGGLKALGQVSVRGPRPQPRALTANRTQHFKALSVMTDKRARVTIVLSDDVAQNASVTGWPPVPESAAARASAAAAAGNTRPGSMRRVPASTSSTSARSWDPSGLTYRFVIVTCRSPAGGSEVIVARRPPSRTRRSADAAPPGAAFTTASKPSGPAVAAAASAHFGSR